MKNNILLVEDDDSLRESLKIILEESHFKVCSVGEGKSALKMLQQSEFQVIILDDNLPFIQGSDLLSLIRINNPKVKIILMSGLFQTGEIQKIKEKGADIVIEKPFEFDHLIETLKAFCS